MTPLQKNILAACKHRPQTLRELQNALQVDNSRLRTSVSAMVATGELAMKNGTYVPGFATYENPTAPGGSIPCTLVKLAARFGFASRDDGELSRIVLEVLHVLPHRSRRSTEEARALFFRVVFQQMSIVFTFFHHLRDVVVQRRRLKLTVGFFTQMEDSQARGEILIIRRIAGNKIRSGFNNGFVNIVGADAVVKLDMRFELDLRHRNIVQTCCRPVDYAVDFIQIDRLQPAVAFGYFQIACCVHRQIPSS